MYFVTQISLALAIESCFRLAPVSFLPSFFLFFILFFGAISYFVAPDYAPKPSCLFLLPTNLVFKEICLEKSTLWRMHGCVEGHCCTDQIGDVGTGTKAVAAGTEKGRTDMYLKK